MKKFRKKTEIHRIGLIHVYESTMTDAGDFMSAVLHLALRELYKGVHPKRVERFVVKMEKTLRSGL